MAIKVPAPVPVKKDLVETDPTKKTWVIFKPPNFAAETERSEMLSQRSIIPTPGGLRTQVDVNLHALWAVDLWVTYVETNLEIEFTDEDGKVVDSAKFAPRAEMGRAEFMRQLNKLPPSVVYEWHATMLEVVPDWAIPF